MSKLKDIQVLSAAAMLAAIAIVLGFFKIPLNQVIEIRFGSLPLSVTGFLFGPVIGAIVGAVADVGGYLIRPTGPFFVGFTISSIVAGTIFGVMLHNKEVTIWRIVLTEVLQMLIVNLFLNTLWLSMLYGKAFIPLVGARIVKELIMLPINCALITFILKSVSHIPQLKKSVTLN